MAREMDVRKLMDCILIHQMMHFHCSRALPGRLTIKLYISCNVKLDV